MGTVSELMQIPASTASEPGGKRLAALLRAESVAETWLARRRMCGRLVILLSAPMAYLILRGLRVDHAGARAILALWIVMLTGLIGCTVAAMRARRRVHALLGEAGGRRLDLDD